MYWLVLIVAGAVSAFLLDRTIPEGSGCAGSYVRRMSAMMLLAIMALLAISVIDETFLSLSVFSVHLSSVAMAVLLAIMSVREGARDHIRYILLSMGIIIPLLLLYSGTMTFYWMNAIAIIVTVGVILFSKEEDAGQGEKGPLRPWLVPTILLIATVSFFWFGLTDLASDFLISQYAIIPVSTASVVVIQVLLSMRAYRRLSHHHGIRLAMWMASMDLIVAFVSAVILWA